MEKAATKQSGLAGASANSASYIKYTTYVVSPLRQIKHANSSLVTYLRIVGNELHPISKFKFGYNKQVG